MKPKNLTISELVTHSSTQVKRENQEFLRSASDFEKQAELQQKACLSCKEKWIFDFSYMMTGRTQSPRIM